MSEELLRDEQFLRIRKLNSLDNGGKRQSVYSEVEDSPGPRELDQLSSNAKGTSTAVENDDTLNNESEAEVAEKDKKSGGCETIMEETATTTDIHYTKSKVDTDGNFERLVIDSHVKTLHGKEKTRYKRDMSKTISYFGDVSFQTRPSILDGSINDPYQESFKGPVIEKLNYYHDSENADVIVESNFAGIYVLCWMAIAFSAMKLTIEYYYEHDHSFKGSEILKFMTTDLLRVAVIDFIMYMNLWVIFLVQYLCKKKVVTWNQFGWKFTSIFEFLFVTFYMVLTENILGLHWVAKIFLFLHSLVMLMKMHSFAFYNGYLWNILEELHYSKKTLKSIKEEEKFTDVCQEMIDTLNRSQEFCSSELASQSTSEQFPQNINVKNFFMYTMFPTLVYQIEYPRTKKIRWRYVLEKLCAIFGTIFLMMVVAQTFMYPIAIRAIKVRETAWTGYGDRLVQWALLLIDLVPSFIVIYLLTFYLIWDAILNCVAELTCFGDRYFYGDWWNCVDWGDFSRIWNIPVHKFLLRHVYHSSISFLNLSKTQATLMTFFISSVVHELSMYVLFKKLRCYLFLLQMLQVPLVAISKSPLLANKPILGNVIFWIGICTGPSIMCTLYLTF